MHLVYNTKDKITGYNLLFDQVVAKWLRRNIDGELCLGHFLLIVMS